MILRDLGGVDVVLKGIFGDLECAEASEVFCGLVLESPVVGEA